MSSQDLTSAEGLFRVDVSHQDGRVVVSLAGELDLATAPRLREYLAALPGPEEHQIVFDLTDLDFIDSTGLSVLVMTFNRSQAAGSSMLIHNPPLAVIRIFEITGLASVFTITTEGEPVSVADG